MGSPPHTRGKVKLRVTAVLERGITPAHAGKSPEFTCIYRSPQDHPRTRGEKSTLHICRKTDRGSPPHTRGKVLPLPLPPFRRRITPAHAGKRQSAYNHGWRGDHPRTRGEKDIVLSDSEIRGGSPPHTRGKGHIRSGCFTVTRITPAHAGKRSGRGLLSNDDPGSPPHTRGKDVRRQSDKPHLGITPAHAGKSVAISCALRRTWDHPRTRGEKRERANSLRAAKGSPPHTRGKVTKARADARETGITPAHAGKRLKNPVKSPFIMLF